MPESLLYFIWQFQYFTKTELLTIDGESVQVLHPGFQNHNAGPDFTHARLLINDVEWVGNVEMHTRTSDWLAHGHQHDRAYDNVILHVVWQDDSAEKGSLVKRTNGTALPTLELYLRTEPSLLSRYQLFIDSQEAIPCANLFRSVSPLRVTSMLDKAMMQRLERKATAVLAINEQTNGDWEETTYRLLATSMGFRINGEPMAQLSRAVSLKAIRKHRDVLPQVEAMLFGTAGLLGDDETDEYVALLRREYQFLSAKYDLSGQQLETHSWKWGRLRPANFPTLRIAQLARLLTYHTSLFSLFIETSDVATLLNGLQIKPSTYWQSHYRFGKLAERTVATLGEQSAAAIVINAVAPLLAAYAQHRGEPAYIDRAINLLEQLPAEKNHLTEAWNELGLSVRTAFDSQAAIELYNEFCSVKKCLSCQIGAALIKNV
ncbi:DUF2851 family protein [Spirosoma sp. BT702]|uniref:DUF2851 family protein n=1 Tax=Spirosoma profusum TaxID=2771354 RepID=A0A926XTQ6_9BACT|nr:DUF2851 family protein [Spirosoma profusum]MBD2699400.1 DUF2851 family protein [Spirosoma profusum]